MSTSFVEDDLKASESDSAQEVRLVRPHVLAYRVAGLSASFENAAAPVLPRIGGEKAEKLYNARMNCQ
jgi:hypothetical protein